MYRAKRRFDVTPEPAGPVPTRHAAKSHALKFVVHKHRATRLHYDLRMEWNGVLLSWAVPKGPSLDPSIKRLAMHTEDHPIDYDEFEGVIPAGEYGGGTMMIWDRGHWVPEDPDVDRGLRRGELKFRLEGEKLHGSFVLVRTGGRGGDRDERSWLLIKHRDEAATGEDVAETRPRSVASGRLLAEIAFEEGGDPVTAATGDPERAVRALMRELAAKGGSRGTRAEGASARPRSRAKASGRARQPVSG
ncbi:MAG TPA: DNA polymerase ligase N-terminal domain-containing protein [Candidatus Binatia bacterium]|nr:DNA polymerase ligase N-terminal domain-containing protein [Candidatus Binatia bacterium]